MAINNFDVLKQMCAENKKIMLAGSGNILDMQYNAKRGTKVTFGVEGNVVFDINNGKLNAICLLFDVEQFNELKARMEQGR